MVRDVIIVGRITTVMGNKLVAHAIHQYQGYEEDEGHDGKSASDLQLTGEVCASQLVSIALLFPRHLVSTQGIFRLMCQCEWVVYSLLATFHFP